MAGILTSILQYVELYKVPWREIWITNRLKTIRGEETDPCIIHYHCVEYVKRGCKLLIILYARMNKIHFRFEFSFFI